jgi:hypothetical protein
MAQALRLVVLILVLDGQISTSKTGKSIITFLINYQIVFFIKDIETIRILPKLYSMIKGVFHFKLKSLNL